MELRDYQQDIVNQVQDRDIVCLPTGTGKSAIIAVLARQFQLKGTVAIVVPTIDLMYQMTENLVKWNCPLKNVTVSVWLSAQSLEADYWLHDECHHSACATWEKLLAKSGAHIGFSATPIRLDGKPLKGFKRVLEPYSLQYFMSKGYLCNNLKEYSIDLGLDSALSEDPDEQYQKLNSRVVYAKILDEYKRFATSKSKAIVYAVTIKHAYHIAKMFYDEGYRVNVIHSQLPSGERKTILKQFHKGEIRILVNVFILGEGIDVKDADLLLMCSRTGSTARFYQMVGRILRPKESAILLDFVGNLDIHGSVKSCTGWADDFEMALRNDEESKTRVLVCAKCGAVKSYGQPCPVCGAESDTVLKPSQLPRELSYSLSEYVLTPYQQVLKKLSNVSDRSHLIIKLIKARDLMTGLSDAMLLQQFLDNRFSSRLAQKIYRQVMGD